MNQPLGSYYLRLRLDDGSTDSERCHSHHGYHQERENEEAIGDVDSCYRGGGACQDAKRTLATIMRIEFLAPPISVL